MLTKQNPKGDFHGLCAFVAGGIAEPVRNFLPLQNPATALSTEGLVHALLMSLAM